MYIFLVNNIFIYVPKPPPNMPVEAGTIRFGCWVRQCKDAAASLCPFSAEACKSSWCSDFYGNSRKINVIK